MQEYLINVLLGMIPVTFAAIVVCIGGFFFRKKLNAITPKGYKHLCKGAFVAWAIGLVLVMTSPSITYKHETFNKIQEQKVIDIYNKSEAERPVGIRDISKPIEANNSEDFEKLVDYTK